MRTGRPGKKVILEDTVGNYCMSFNKIGDAAVYLAILGYANSKAASESISKNIKGAVKTSYGRFKFYRDYEKEAC